MYVVEIEIINERPWQNILGHYRSQPQRGYSLSVRLKSAKEPLVNICLLKNLSRHTFSCMGCKRVTDFSPMLITDWLL